MSKSTKIIAALGVVAGLGVAALPAFTYAAQEDATTTGDVDVYVEVQPAIAMTITGNNDDASEAGTAWAYSTVTPEGTENPHALGWLERSGSDPDYVYTLTEDETVDGDKTYYTGTGIRAVDSFAPETAASSSIDGHTTPSYSQIGTSSSYVSMLPNALANTISTVTIYTNNVSGYKLSVKANGSADMTQQGVSAPDTPDTIAAISSTPAVGTPGWGFKVAEGTGSHAGSVVSGFEADNDMTTSDQDIVTSSTQTSSGDQWVVTYDVATKADQSAGLYKVNLTYTATTDNS